MSPTAFSLLIAIPLWAWKGYVFSVLWDWFVVALFPSVPHMPVGIAIGIIIIAMLFKHPNFVEAEYRERKWTPWQSALIDMVVSILMPLMALFYGWLIQWLFLR